MLRILDGPSRQANFYSPECSTGQDYAGNVKARAAGRVQAEVLWTCLWFGVEERSQGQERGWPLSTGRDRESEDSLRGGNRHLGAEDSQGRILSISEQHPWKLGRHSSVSRALQNWCGSVTHHGSHQRNQSRWRRPHWPLAAQAPLVLPSIHPVVEYAELPKSVCLQHSRRPKGASSQRTMDHALSLHLDRYLPSGRFMVELGPETISQPTAQSFLFRSTS